MPEPAMLDDAVQQELLRPFPPAVLTRLHNTLPSSIPTTHLFIRLNKAVGPGGWHLTFKDWSHGTSHSVTASLTILGITREGRGGHEYEKSACCDAFQAACAMFGLGLYLHSLPTDKDPRALPAEVHAEAAKKLGWCGGVKNQEAPPARREASEGAPTWSQREEPAAPVENPPAVQDRPPLVEGVREDGLLAKARGLLSLCVDKGLVTPEKQAECMEWLGQAPAEEINDLICQMQEKLSTE